MLLVATAGMGTRLPWALTLWRWADGRPTTWFVASILASVAVGAALVPGFPDVMPWPVQPRLAVPVGWIVLGDAVCFALPALLHPMRNDARVALLSFLACDLAPAPPLARHHETVKPGRLASLVVCLAVLAYSAALTLFQLSMHPAAPSGWLAATALTRSRPARP